MHELSIVLPCYNERENIVPLVSSLIRVFSHLGDALQIIVVDDNSPDHTASLVREAFQDDRRVDLIVRMANRGFAFSIREGIEKANGRTILVMDTDFNHPPELAPALFEAAQTADIASASRFIAGGGMPDRKRYLLSGIYNLFMRILLLSSITDHLCGFFAARADVLKSLDFDKIFWGYGDYFFRLLVLAERKRLKVVEIPVFYGVRPGGVVKTRFLSIFAQYTGELLKLVYWRVTARW